MKTKEYWYIVYEEMEAPEGRSHTKWNDVIDEHPVEFAAASAEKEYGPYVVLFAIPITKTQYDKHKAGLE